MSIFRSAVLISASLVLAGVAEAQEAASPHRWTFMTAGGLAGASTDLDAWTDGGLGKLRYDEHDDGAVADRLVAIYRGQLSPTLFATAMLDYVNDASAGLDVTEAFLEWRPVPSSPSRQRWKLGAFYPPFSLENRGEAWSSPYTLSSSAINTWLGEEIRALGAEWSLRRRLGGPNGPHELGVVASAFYGSDPAGTVLFWRGWSVHDRQTRLTDRLQIPAAPVWGSGGAVVGLRDQFVEPLADVDGEPGVYAAVEWQYARRALLQLAYYDNRADPYAFSGGQWAWDTSFTQLGVQLDLPADFGLVAQWMSGQTYWLIGVAPDGIVPSYATLEIDLFDSYFVLLTRELGDAHRLSLRYDDFDIVREEAPPALVSDSGSAVTLGYRFAHRSGMELAVEWMEIESARDPWSWFYGIPRRATETQLRIELIYRLDFPSIGREPSR